MTDREALAAALERHFPRGNLGDSLGFIGDAARERLAQLPPYPPALVNRVTALLSGYYGTPQRSVTALAVAILDAINNLSESGSTDPAMGDVRNGVSPDSEVLDHLNPPTSVI